MVCEEQEKFLADPLIGKHGEGSPPRMTSIAGDRGAGTGRMQDAKYATQSVGLM